MVDKLRPEEQTASEALAGELEKPPEERSAQKIEDINEAIRTTNEMQRELEKKGQEAGLAPSGLKPEAVVDKEGNITGFTAKR